MTETRMQQLYSRRVAARGAGADCVTPEAILAVVRREGPEEERLGTLEHVMSCSACHREYEWLVAVDQAGLEAEDAAEAGAAPRRAWWRGGAPLALAASIAVVVGAAVVLSRTNRTEGVRGVTGDIMLVAPGQGAVVGAPLVFTWRALPGVSRYVLEVQRADGSVALADTTADTTVTISQPSALVPDSAYRWWVREVTEGTQPRSSELREVRVTGR